MIEFISRKYGKEGYEIIIKTDNHEHYRTAEEFARRLIDHTKPMTNADIIRSMHDFDLALFLHKMLGMDVPTALRWLQTPVTEDTE